MQELWCWQLGHAKRNHKELPLSGKVNILDLIRKEKKSYAEVAEIYIKNESSIMKFWRRKKKFVLVLLLYLKLQKLRPQSMMSA